MGTILEILSGLAKPVIVWFNKNILPWLIKQWKIVIPIFILLLSIISITFIYNKQKNEIQSLKNQLAKTTGTQQVALNIYQTQVQELDKIKIDNDNLNKIIKKNNSNIIYYSNLSLKYKTKIDSILTYTRGKDTSYVYINNTQKHDSTDRLFSKTFNNEVFLNGYFQIHAPYMLFLDSLKFLMNIDIALSQNSIGDFISDIDTHSRFLSPSQVNVNVTSLPDKLQYFYGGSITFNNNLLSGYIGLKKGNWSLLSGIDYINNKIGWKIGILKFNTF